MKVLLAYASRYGSTKAIAERIAAKIRETGVTIDVVPAKEVDDASGYDRTSSAAPSTSSTG
jgi:menaquinone-dependent protoporphyrinogen oxidase